jgi:hypothetical protein
VRVLMRVLMGIAAIAGGISLVLAILLEDNATYLMVLIICLIVLVVGTLAGAAKKD